LQKLHSIQPNNEEKTLASQRKSCLASYPLKKQQVLLLHGNIEQRGDISELLTTKLRYDVTEVMSGQEALYAIHADKIIPDAIILDISSVNAADRAITELTALRMHIPIIVLVKYGDYQQAAESLLLGAHDFITKPFAEERLSITLRNAIALQNAKKEAASALKIANTTQANAIQAGKLTQTQPNVEMGDTIISLIGSAGEVRKMEEIEKTAICFAVRFYNGRMSEVARKLGIGRSTLYRKLDAIGKI